MPNQSSVLVSELRKVKTSRDLGREISIAIMQLIITIVAICSLLWGERLQVNGGFGWDGQNYGEIARNLNLSALDPYYFQRILPSTVVHFVLIVLQQRLDNRSIVSAFFFLNLILMLFSCVVYRFIAKELDLNPFGLWLGFIGIFVNFACFRFAWYYPVLTDVAVILLSLAMLLFYLRRKTVALVIITLLGSFTWPSLIYVGFMLLAFPREPIEEKETSFPNWLAAGLVMLTSAGVVAMYYIFPGYTRSQPVQIHSAIPFSLILCLLYVFYGTVVLMRGVPARTFQSSLTPRRAALVAGLFAAVKIPAYLWSDHTKHAVSMAGTVAATVARSVARPLVFVVAHAIYFGPVFLLFLLCWKPFSKVIRNHGLGLTLVCLSGLFLSINSESRQNLPSYVIAVPFLALTTQKLAFPAQLMWLMGALALLSTKIWIRMNLPAYTDSWQHQRFPFQNLFMNLGPWMNNQMYWIQGCVVLCTAVLLYTYLRHLRRQSL